jgi:hypothetical protein
MDECLYYFGESLFSGGLDQCIYMPKDTALLEIIIVIWRVYIAQNFGLIFCPLYKVHQNHRLNMESDLQSLFGLHVHAQLSLLAETPQPPASLKHLGSYRRALLVSQDRDSSLWPLMIRTYWKRKLWLMFVTAWILQIIVAIFNSVAACFHYLDDIGRPVKTQYSWINHRKVYRCTMYLKD